MTETPTKVVRSLRRHPAVWWSRMKWRWPLLFWLAAAIATAFFYFHGASTSGILGYVEVVEHSVGSIEDGIVRSITVQVGDSVQAGALLGNLDDSFLAAEQAIEQAYLSDAQGQVPEALQFMTQIDRQFAAALNGAEKDLQDLLRLQSSEQAELEVVIQELVRLEKLHAERLIPASDLADLRTRRAVLERQIADYPAQIEARQAVAADWRRQVEKIRRYAEGAVGDSPKDSTQVQNFTAEAHQNLVRLLELRRKAMALRSPVSGTVSGVDYQPGSVVMAGTAVLRVIDTNSERVVGFLPEAVGSALRLGDRIGVYRMYTARSAGTATLLAIEPTIRALPGRVSPVATRTIRGRALYFKLDPGHDLTPGETVELHVNEPWAEAVRRWFTRFRAGGS